MGRVSCEHPKPAQDKYPSAQGFSPGQAHPTGMYFPARQSARCGNQPDVQRRCASQDILAPRARVRDLRPPGASSSEMSPVTDISRIPFSRVPVLEPVRRSTADDIGPAATSFARPRYASGVRLKEIRPSARPRAVPREWWRSGAIWIGFRPRPPLFKTRPNHINR